MTYPPVIVVDEYDNEIGSEQLPEVWRKGLYHRIVAVFVQDEQGRMLLQLRGPEVGIYRNFWDQAAGGHVDEGQSYEQAAYNELFEETGIKDVELHVLDTIRTNSKEGDCILNRFERSYLAKVPHDIALHPEAKEVHALRWFTPEELRQLIAEPDKLTPGLLRGLRTYYLSAD